MALAGGGGMTVWICGMSGVGKTTIANELVERFRTAVPGVVNADGDAFRGLFGFESKASYSLDARSAVTRRLRGLCRWLNEQRIHVVATNISAQRILLDENRQEIERYFEVHLHAPIEVLSRRDPKGLYAAAKSGVMSDVVGVDLAYEAPASPDLRFDTSLPQKPGEIADEIWLRIKDAV